MMTASLVLLSSGVVHAASWQTTVALPMTTEHDTNPRLDAEDEKGVTRTTIAPDYTLIGAFGLDELRFGIGLNLERSSDQSIALDREDPKLLLGWQRETERGGFGLTAKYDESSTLFSELEETGVVTGDGTRKKYNLAGNWRAAISERSTLASDADYTRVRYDVDSLTSYDELSTKFSWSYGWSELLEPYAEVSLSRYEPVGGTVTASSTRYGPMSGLRFTISEQLQGVLRAGVNQVSGDEGGPSWQGGFELSYIGERFDTSIDVGRSTITSGEGGFTEVSQLRASWSYAVSETLRAGLDASLQDNKSTAPNTMRQINLWASQELSPFWVARLSLTYRQRQQDERPDASANVLGVTLIYNHPDF
ncbi:hypothetical protein SAMN05216600_11322 [Pseudomonas cuatrocienegasensis]|uniref:DUF560 domain-containing protein n=1 Tax=Pseudomonas cuatrocienegasensis TaxID=543360 RepID=A0ABY1BJ80_9PSED|nr:MULTISPECIES: hypothetical protein [Pseudomonas]SEQ99658.1 hypothetical protein SAMN05216600_11322 [Pseudomonas cuatrocienegasensis]